MVIVDSTDRIAGYLVLRQHPLDDGRVVVVDRGEQYRNRYCVAWQPHDARGWANGVLLEDLAVAIEVFVARCDGEHRAREYPRHR